jgi:hypothetical protein
MQLLDTNGTCIAAMMVESKGKPVFNEDLLRHQIINMIRSYRTKFYNDYGEIVLCFDGKHYWRKEIFPYYKANRKKARDDSSFDWDKFFIFMDSFRTELAETFPYKVMRVDRCEADDVIATLCKNRWRDEKILILSNDSDFVQLQKYETVTQWAPRDKKYIKESNPQMYLKEHILRGDAGDGVPNFLSDDDTFVNASKRQKPIRNDKMTGWLEHDPKDYCDTKMLRNFDRNRQLVDLSLIPADVEASIMAEWNKPVIGKRSKILNYFIQHRMRQLMESVTEF